MKTLNEQVFELVPIFHTQVSTWIDKFKANIENEVDKMLSHYIDELFLKILGLEKDNWGDIRIKQGYPLIEAILQNRAVAQIDKVLDCNMNVTLTKKVRAEYKREFESQLVRITRKKASEDAVEIAKFIHTELKNSAICLEDIQSYIKTFYLIEGDSK